MTLYELNAELMAAIDWETGEVLDAEKLDALVMAREEKLENIALYIKNLTAEAAALKAEKDAFAERQKAAENKAARLKDYLAENLAGQKFETTKVKVSFRKSETLQIAEGAKVPETFLRYKDPEVNKVELKKAVKGGLELDGVQIVEKMNLQLK